MDNQSKIQNGQTTKTTPPKTKKADQKTKTTKKNKFLKKHQTPSKNTKNINTKVVSHAEQPKYQIYKKDELTKCTINPKQHNNKTTTKILLYMKGVRKKFVSASNERQSSRDSPLLREYGVHCSEQPQTVHMYSQFVVVGWPQTVHMYSQFVVA